MRTSSIHLVPLILTMLAAPGHARVAALVSRNDAGVAADTHSYSPAISGSGQVVAFSSWASNLSPGLSTSNAGVFARDVLLQRTELVSRPYAGGAPDGPSYRPAISADGRWVAFWSDAGNLVPNDGNGDEDVFLFDRETTAMTRVNLSSAGVEAGAMDHGAHVVGSAPSVSGDGRFVAFDSRAANLVAGDTNGRADVFVRDVLTGTTERVSACLDGLDTDGGGDLPAISDDGRWVAFRSLYRLTADDDGSAFDVYLFDRVEGALVRVGPTFASTPAVNADGTIVAFDSLADDLVPNDTNAVRDIFVWQRLTRAVSRVSVGAGGAQATDLSDAPSLSADGRYVAFRSLAADLVVGDANEVADVFLRDRQAGTTRRLSVGWAEGDLFSGSPAIDDAGFFVAMESAASTFAADDTHGAQDIFLAVREDACPNQVKLYPGVCGCGSADADSDRDRTFDCEDDCPDDGGKVAAGVCGCGHPDVDSDEDGTLDCLDGCPTDAAKLQPGPCGCGQGEQDGDADGVADCRDPASVRDLRHLYADVADLMWRAAGRGAEQASLVQELRQSAAWFTAIANNAALPKRVRGASTALGRALSAVPDPSARTFARRFARAQKRLAVLLRVIG